MREDIRKARAAHASLRDLRDSSTIILRTPSKRIFQTLANPDISLRQAAFVGRVDGNDGLRLIHGFPAVRSTEYDAIWNAVVEDKRDLEFSWRLRWEEFRDDALLKDMLAGGVLPIAFWSESGPEAAPSLQMDLRRARDHGYNVPDKFTEDRRATSYSESEAWYAANMLARGNFSGCFRRPVKAGGPHGENYSLAQHCGGFVIPDPIQTRKTPYVADQLWVVLYPGRRVRLIVLEIDGEVHLSRERVEADRRRDAALEARGYEVYHVAGWWCRIDATRVIVEFLAAAGLKDLRDILIGGNLSTPASYICGLCREPMVRFDQHWIKHDRRYGCVHQDCYETIQEQNGHEDDERDEDSE